MRKVDVMRRILQTIYFISTVTLLILYSHNSTAQRPCTTNFSESGEWNTGKGFRTWVEFVEADENRAFQAVGRFVATEGLLGLTTNKDIGTITAYQEDNGKRSPFIATFSKVSGGKIRVEASMQLARGLRAPVAAMRDWLCKVIEEAVPEGQLIGSENDEGSGVEIRTSTGDVKLAASVGEFRQVALGPVLLFFYDFRSARAAARSTDQQLRLVIRKKTDPSTGYVLVRFKSDAGDDRRSIKMGSAGKLLKMGVTGAGELAPDEDWTIGFTSSQESPGAWIVTPKEPLKPGEYGLWDVKGYGVAAFGID